MKVFAISDFHLSTVAPKPMDIFGGAWEGHWEKILANSQKAIDSEDLLLIAGDISWAMNLAEAQADLSKVALLPGSKVIIRGNHDYWWSSYAQVVAALPQNIFALQNNAFKFGSIIVCGSRGWGEKDTPQDKKIYERELIRMRLSLQEGSKLREQGDKLIALIHYPPFEDKGQPSPFTQLFAEFEVSAVVYGHLHGLANKVATATCLDGIRYYLTSCDILNNIPIEVIF